MITVLAIIGLGIILISFYILCDTITEALSGGKSFAPKELKGF